ncbi:MAG: 2-amino-4-hydroxy-6-hydroxymethyldihydropteridine diphosphokinase [Pyrinomonadaceae bacterium]|nr:2-amino-4-hydroxy-6-hydroxymethyldihydropteridine diphosphokinase [Pyrinomonadaceae bacterium]
MTSETVTTYVGLGSNLGDRAGNLMLAVRGLLEASLSVTRLSALYETEPFGVEHQDNYLNMVAEVEIRNITPEQMLARMLRIEYLLGRRREYPKSARTVDLDLLAFGDSIHKNDFVTLPHPQLHLRNFVLIPFAEIAPTFKHPKLNQTIKELMQKTSDKSKVKRWQPK